MHFNTNSEQLLSKNTGRTILKVFVFTPFCKTCVEGKSVEVLPSNMQYQAQEENRKKSEKVHSSVQMARILKYWKQGHDSNKSSLEPDPWLIL